MQWYHFDLESGLNEPADHKSRTLSDLMVSSFSEKDENSQGTMMKMSYTKVKRVNRLQPSQTTTLTTTWN